MKISQNGSGISDDTVLEVDEQDVELVSGKAKKDPK